jgi:hypothetical protein
MPVHRNAFDQLRQQALRVVDHEVEQVAAELVRKRGLPEWEANVIARDEVSARRKEASRRQEADAKLDDANPYARGR